MKYKNKETIEAIKRAFKYLRRNGYQAKCRVGGSNESMLSKVSTKEPYVIFNTNNWKSALWNGTLNIAWNGNDTDIIKAFEDQGLSCSHETIGDNTKKIVVNMLPVECDKIHTVSYKQAVALKRIGFDTPTKKVFNDKTKTYDDSFSWSIAHISKNWVTNYLSIKSFIPAPTFQQAADWVLKTHNQDLSVMTPEVYGQDKALVYGLDMFLSKHKK